MTTEPSLVVDLVVEPARVTPVTLPELEISGFVMNAGTETVDTLIHASELLVDGEPSAAWMLAIGSGTRDEREAALPPGERVEFVRVMGGSLFTSAGEHELVLVVHGTVSLPVRVTLDA